uniref:Uncharacterized protein n=1 Tax=Anguilla anguilla TaxID=7936 RepID=A0A0E9VDC4_ANGAN
MSVATLSVLSLPVKTGPHLTEGKY